MAPRQAKRGRSSIVPARSRHGPARRRALDRDGHELAQRLHAVEEALRPVRSQRHAAAATRRRYPSAPERPARGSAAERDAAPGRRARAGTAGAGPRRRPQRVGQQIGDAARLAPAGRDDPRGRPSAKNRPGVHARRGFGITANDETAAAPARLSGDLRRGPGDQAARQATRARRAGRRDRVLTPARHRR